MLQTNGHITPLGLKVKELRSEKRLTSLKVAEKAQVSFSLITQLETGRRKYLTCHEIDRLASALEVAPDDLWGLVPGGRSERKWIPITAGNA